MKDGSDVRTRTTFFVISVLAAAALTGCGTTDAKHRATGGSAQEPTAKVGNIEPRAASTGAPGEVDEPHAAAGLLESRALSELTLSGTVTAVRDGVADPTEPRFRLALVTIRPTEVFKGSADQDIQLVLMSTFEPGHSFNIPGQPIPEVGSSGTWFLKRVPAGAAVQGFIPISSGAQILFAPSGKVVSHGEQAALREAASLGTRERVSALLRRAGS